MTQIHLKHSQLRERPNSRSANRTKQHSRKRHLYYTHGKLRFRNRSRQLRQRKAVLTNCRIRRPVVNSVPTVHEDVRGHMTNDASHTPAFVTHDLCEYRLPRTEFVFSTHPEWPQYPKAEAAARAALIDTNPTESLKVTDGAQTPSSLQLHDNIPHIYVDSFERMVVQSRCDSRSDRLRDISETHSTPNVRDHQVQCPTLCRHRDLSGSVEAEKEDDTDDDDNRMPTDDLLALQCRQRIFDGDFDYQRLGRDTRWRDAANIRGCLMPVAPSSVRGNNQRAQRTHRSPVNGQEKKLELPPDSLSDARKPTSSDVVSDSDSGSSPSSKSDPDSDIDIEDDQSADISALQSKVSDTAQYIASSDEDPIAAMWLRFERSEETGSTFVEVVPESAQDLIRNAQQSSFLVLTGPEHIPATDNPNTSAGSTFSIVFDACSSRDCIAVAASTKESSSLTPKDKSCCIHSTIPSMQHNKIKQIIEWLNKDLGFDSCHVCKCVYDHSQPRRCSGCEPRQVVNTADSYPLSNRELLEYEPLETGVSIRQDYLDNAQSDINQEDPDWETVTDDDDKDSDDSDDDNAANSAQEDRSAF